MQRYNFIFIYANKSSKKTRKKHAEYFFAEIPDWYRWQMADGSFLGEPIKVETKVLQYI